MPDGFADSLGEVLPARTIVGHHQTFNLTEVIVMKAEILWILLALLLAWLASSLAADITVIFVDKLLI